MNYREVKGFARELRKNQTNAEVKLWHFIRGRKLKGRKFLRQHPLMVRFNHDDYYYFIPDFYCHQEKLLIELDGSVHDFRVIEDSVREGTILKAGYKVIRFRNEELIDINLVLSKIESQFTD